MTTRGGAAVRWAEHVRAVRQNATIDEAIQESLRTTHYSQCLALEGITTVALDDAGHLVEHHPDGTVNRLDDDLKPHRQETS